MSRQDTGARNTARTLLEGQLAHLILLGVLLWGLQRASRVTGFWQGELWDIPTSTWVYLSVGVAIVHQVYVWLCWRVEIHSSLLTRVLGARAFTVYASVFAVLIVLRPILLTLLALSNRGTVHLAPGIIASLTVLLAMPLLYLFWSVHRYFGFQRAAGLDHFDASIRTQPFVEQGIFTYTRNAMYVFGFLLLWIPAILWSSVAALFVALFSHLYIWVHFYCTERPDMRHIYASPR